MHCIIKLTHIEVELLPQVNNCLMSLSLSMTYVIFGWLNVPWESQSFLYTLAIPSDSSANKRYHSPSAWDQFWVFFHSTPLTAVAVDLEGAAEGVTNECCKMAKISIYFLIELKNVKMLFFVQLLHYLYVYQWWKEDMLLSTCKHTGVRFF